MYNLLNIYNIFKFKYIYIYIFKTYNINHKHPTLYHLTGAEPAQVPALGWLQIVGFAGIVELNAGGTQGLGGLTGPENDPETGRNWGIHCQNRIQNGGIVPYKSN